MGAMRQWMHQSELYKFLDSQRCLARNRMPTTPSITGLPPQQPAPDDWQRLEQIATALHNLRLRLSSYPELVEHVDDILEYVEQIQNDYPLQGPNRAFERLLHLRSTIFWVPTTILQPEESDLGALAMLAHFYALALVLEPLFPECGGMYLGNMALDPLEKVCQVMQARSANVPHDSALQTALSMLDVPIQIAVAYRASRRTNVSTQSLPHRYHAQPTTHQAAYPAQAYNLPSPPSISRHASYQSSTLHSPANILPMGYQMSNFPNQINTRHDSMGNRTQSDHRLGMVSPLSSASSLQQSGSETNATNIDYFAGASSYPTMSSTFGGMNEYQNRLVHAPHSSQIWT